MIGTIEQMIKDMAARKRGRRMRIISQNNKKDFPYEMCTIWTLENKIIASPIGEPETEAVMAEYSTQEKAEKAMQKLHNYYQERSVGVVFRFPQEDEI